MIKVYPTAAPTSILEQSKYLAEALGGTVASVIAPEQVNIAVVVGPPNNVFEAIFKSVQAKRYICYWITEGILTAIGRRIARTARCDLSVAPSMAVKRWMEESDIYIDAVIPHEVRVPNIAINEKLHKAVYIGGNYARKFSQMAIETIRHISDVIDVYYRAEVPDVYAQPLNKAIESLGAKRLEKMSKEELMKLIAQYSVFASLSVSEGFGLFQREALALGLNLVVINHDAFWDILNHPCVYPVKIISRAYIVTTRSDVYEEFNAWDVREYSETLRKALERECTEPLKYVPHYAYFAKLAKSL